MVDPEGRELLILVARLKSLGPIFWGLALTGVVACLDLMLASAGVLRWLLSRSPREELEVPRWAGTDVLLVWLIWFLCANGVLLVLAAVPRGVIDESIGRSVQIGASLAVMALAAAFAVTLLRLAHGQGPGALGLHRRALSIAPRSLMLYLALVPGIYGLTGLWDLALTLGGVPLPPQSAALEFLSALVDGDGLRLALILAYGVVVAPVFEEIVFRGLLHRWLRTRLPAGSAALLGGAIFGLVHFNVMAFLPVAGLGVVLAWTLERTGSLWCCIALHAVFNGGQFLLMVLAAGA